jgi:hypothetical protein
MAVRQAASSSGSMRMASSAIARQERRVRLGEAIAPLRAVRSNTPAAARTSSIHARTPSLTSSNPARIWPDTCGSAASTRGTWPAAIASRASARSSVKLPGTRRTSLPSFSNVMQPCAASALPNSDSSVRSDDRAWRSPASHNSPASRSRATGRPSLNAR